MSLRIAIVMAFTALPVHAQSADEPPPTADSATVGECAQAYERGQEQRKNGELIAARETLTVCAREECPPFVRDDCSLWLASVQEELPTLVFMAQSRGRDLTEVQIVWGKRAVAHRLDGKAVELDPGEYDFTFSAPDMRPLTQHVVIARGERNRLVRVELDHLRAPVDATTQPAPVRVERSLLLPAVFTGVGVVGLAGFGVVGAWGRASETTLADTCAPDCRSDQVAGVKTKYLIADVSLGVGLASLAVGAYLFLSSGSGAQPASASGLEVQASASRLNASYRGRF